MQISERRDLYTQKKSPNMEIVGHLRISINMWQYKWKKYLQLPTVLKI